ncbi:PAS domain-containing protein [Halovenus halobia]|uniref:PAS domain-containing protein n=1 Tax=Halovenus halobia TaxID=3396622 RepID=UPI003F551DD8
MKLRRAFAVVIAIVAVVLGVAVVSGFQLYDGAVSDREQQSAETAATATATQVETLLAERARTVELAATDPAVLDASQQRRATLQRLVEQTPFHGVSVVRANGTMTAIESAGLTADRRAEVIGSEFSDRTYVREGLAGQTYVSDPVEAETGNLVVTISTPVREDNSIVAVLTAALHIRDGDFLDSLSVIGGTAHEVRIVAGSQQLYASKSFDDHAEYTSANATISPTGWTVTATQVDDSAAETQLVTSLQLGAGGLVLLCLFGFGAWFKRSNLNQIDELLAGFDRLAERSYGTQISVGGSQEWEQIGAQFNEMSAELARHARELKQYREIVERVSDPIAIQNCDGEHLLANQALSEYAGYDSSDIIGADESLYLDDDAAAHVAEKRQEVLDTEQAIEYELSVQFSETSIEKTFSAQQYPYYDETGALAGTLSLYRDVTDLKDREAELEQYKRAVDGATDLICAVDENREYLFANPQYCAYHGLDQESIRGVNSQRVTPDKIVTDNVDRALDGETVKYKMTRDHADGSQRILDVRYYPLGTGDDNAGFVAVLRDVTEREERARQLRVVDRVLRHNLRNDLTVISLEAERIAAGASGPVADSAEGIQNHAEELLTTSTKSRAITDVLSEQPDRVSIDATDVLTQGASNVDDGVAVTLDIPDREVLVSAVTGLRKAVDELVTNAVAHNDQSDPSVDLSLEEDEQSVVLRVADNGPGMAEMDRDVLESGRAIEDLYHGSGLGLWLVYWTVQRSGGSITVRDRTPRGTVVELELPTG